MPISYMEFNRTPFGFHVTIYNKNGNYLFILTRPDGKQVQKKYLKNQPMQMYLFKKDLLKIQKQLRERMLSDHPNWSDETLLQDLDYKMFVQFIRLLP